MDTEKIKKNRIFLCLILLLPTIYTVWFFSDFFGISRYYVEPINKTFNSLKPVDKSCNIDADCKIARIDCAPCSRLSTGSAVNKNYQPFCPLEYLLVACRPAPPPWAVALKAVCINHSCVGTQKDENKDTPMEFFTNFVQ